MSGPVLVLDRVCVAFADRPLLVEVSLTLTAGERVAILGRNGAGKSTLLDVAAGVRAPDSGEARVLGMRPPAPGIGFVPQDPGASLLPWLSVRQNIQLPLRLAGASPREQARALAAVAAEVDPGARIGLDAPPDTLSGGETQSVAWMRALIARPALILADEPFSALDDAARTRLGLLIARLDTALVLVTHDPAEAAHLADRTLLLAGGTLRPLGAGAVRSVRSRA